jgi:hypothetical protein
MPIEHIEPQVRAGVASLKAGLNPAIDAINAAHSDFAIEHVPDAAYHPGGLAKAPTVWPVVEVSASDVLLSDVAIGQSAFNRAESTMIVALWCRHVDDEQLYYSQLRYGQALLQVLLTLNAFGDTVYVERGRASYRRRNPEAGAPDQLVGFVVVVLQVVTDEEPG